MSIFFFPRVVKGAAHLNSSIQNSGIQVCTPQNHFGSCRTDWILLDVSKLSGDEVSFRLRKTVEFRYQ